MITLDEFKKLATDTGLMLWVNDELFYQKETTWYLCYPLPMFRENCEEEDDYKLKSALISFAPYKEPAEIFIYGNILYDFDHLDKLVEGKEIYCYNMIFDKQHEINLEKIKGDF